MREQYGSFAIAYFDKKTDEDKTDDKETGQQQGCIRVINPNCSLNDFAPFDEKNGVVFALLPHPKYTTQEQAQEENKRTAFLQDISGQLTKSREIDSTQLQGFNKSFLVHPNSPTQLHPSLALVVLACLLLAAYQIPQVRAKVDGSRG